MILVGLLIGFVLFVAVTLLCITIPEMSILDWLLIGVVVLAAIFCGIKASKSKSEANKYK